MDIVTPTLLFGAIGYSLVYLLLGGGLGGAILIFIIAANARKLARMADGRFKFNGAC
jgi:hypothetical protein